MFDSGTSVLLLAGCGLLLLRPSDVPLFARFAGRLAGMGVRGLRGLRSATEEVMKEGETLFSKQGGDVGAVREDLKASLSKFESVRSTVSRDMAGVRAFAPVEMLRSRIKGSLTAKERATIPTERNTDSSASSFSASRSDGSIQRVASVMPRPEHGNKVTTGVDFIARSIEEAALAQQRKRLFGGPLSRERRK